MAEYWVVLGVVAFTVWALLKSADVHARAGDRNGARNCIRLALVAWGTLIGATLNLVFELSERGL